MADHRPRQDDCAPVQHVYVVADDNNLRKRLSEPLQTEILARAAEAEPDVEHRFNAGSIALKCVTLLMWAYIGLRILAAYKLTWLLRTMRNLLATLTPILEATTGTDQQRVRPIAACIIVFLSYNLSVTLALLVALIYAIYAYALRHVFSQGANAQRPSDETTKSLMRAIGTVLFYLALLPEAITALILSGMVTDAGILADRRISAGLLKPAEIDSIGNKLGCDFNDVNSTCLLPDDANRTSVSKLLFAPMRIFLRQYYLPEAFSQMFIIIVAFLVTHIIRRRGTWELDHRVLLRQTALYQMPEHQRQGKSKVNALTKKCN